MKVKKVICLYGGPGSGKTTTMAGLFYKLKMSGYNAEMIPEYIKDWVWEGRKIKNGDQTYFFAKQSRKERVYIENEMDFIVTDSPLILTHYYGMKFDEMEQQSNTSLNMLANHHTFTKQKGYKVDHFLLTRCKKYNPAGRFQTEDEARSIDVELKQLLDDKGIKYDIVLGDENAVDSIIKILKEKV